MKCKKCWRECGPARFVTEFGAQVAPAYCDERHGGLQQTIAEMRKHLADGCSSAKPALMNVGGGLSRHLRTDNPEVVAEREARRERKRQKHAKVLAEWEKSRPKKPQKGDNKNKKKKNRGGKSDGTKKGKTDKNALKNIKYGAAPTPQAASTNPPAPAPSAESKE